MIAFSLQLSEINLNVAIREHFVNDVAFCSNFVYVEVAFTTTRYIVSRMTSNELVSTMNLSIMKIFRSFIVNATRRIKF